MTVGLLDLLDAAIMTGRGPGLDWQPYTVWDTLHRLGAMQAFFEVDHAQRLVATPFQDLLDSTERSMASYHLGMTLALVWARACVGVPFLAHLDVYGPIAGAVVTTHTRPDLIGCTPGQEWVVVEAKGRRRFTSALADQVRDQKLGVTFHGLPPWLSLGSIAVLHNTGVSMRVIDPEGETDREALDLRADPAALVTAAYSPLRDLLSRLDAPQIELDNQPVRLVELPALDLAVGLQAEVEYLLDERPDELLLDSVFTNNPRQTPGLILRPGPAWEGLDRGSERLRR
jgi:hypothetical protein